LTNPLMGDPSFSPVMTAITQRVCEIVSPPKQ
jgi:hypothetical protein